MKEMFIGNEQGYSLIEILVALAITGIVTAAIYSSFISQQKSYTVQDQVAEMQQNLRAGLELMAREIRMAGYDKAKYSILNSAYPLPPNGHQRIIQAMPSVIQFTADLNEDGDTSDSGEDIVYQLQPAPANTLDGPNYLLRIDKNTPAPANPEDQAIAQNVEAVGFAYAFDDGNNQLATAGGQTIWAIDSDGDKKLDTNLDVNGDGFIDVNDDVNADNTINSSDNASAVINPAVDLDKIRAVRIWLLVRTSLPDRKFVDTRKYVVGNKIVTPVNGYRYRLLSTIVKCRNMGL